jgi:pantoate kinase
VVVLPIFVRQSGPMPPSVILSGPSTASLIESYQPEVLFGLLQTPDYARAVEQADAFAPDDDLVARRVAHRLRRKEIFERTSPVSVRVVLGAGVLARQVGGPQVMADQIAHLHEVVRVEVRVPPWEGGAQPCAERWRRSRAPCPASGEWRAYLTGRTGNTPGPSGKK